jgi:hypothetical protein
MCGQERIHLEVRVEIDPVPKSPNGGDDTRDELFPRHGLDCRLSCSYPLGLNSPLTLDPIRPALTRSGSVI